jgi:hypothetical protein
MFAAVTMVTLAGGVGVARAQEGPIDHLRYRTHQIAHVTQRVVSDRRPVVRVYVDRHHRHRYARRHYSRHRVYDRRHHRYYWTYRRY